MFYVYFFITSVVKCSENSVILIFYGNCLPDEPNSVRFYLTVWDLACMLPSNLLAYLPTYLSAFLGFCSVHTSLNCLLNSNHILMTCSRKEPSRHVRTAMTQISLNIDEAWSGLSQFFDTLYSHHHRFCKRVTKARIRLRMRSLIRTCVAHIRHKKPFLMLITIWVISAHLKKETKQITPVISDRDQRVLKQVKEGVKQHISF